jgi:precorrin-6B methylase 2
MNRTLVEFRERIAVAARRRWLSFGRRVNRHMRPARTPPRGFFDDYQRYYSTSLTGATPDRLNQRYRALIVANKEIIKGKTVLDIASHDGRWSFAALAIGAKRVWGIEAREHLIISAEANLRQYGIAEEDRCRFIQGDVLDEIDRIESGSIDTVFCFGFFYHTIHHLLLLSKIARLKPQHLIIDTQIDLRPVDGIFVRRESTEEEGNVALAGAKHTVVGVPTRGALELMLANFGWTPRYYNWHQAGIRLWDDLPDYYEGWRVSLVIDCGVSSGC